MRLRVLLEPHHGATYAQILALATAAEEGGFDAFFRSDHYLGIDADDTTYEPTDSWTTLAGLGVQTSRVRLGTLVTASTFRLPGQLAVEVATVDQMSGGRAELGIGAAWYEREHQYFGIPFPPLGERFDRLEEQLAILTGLWDTKPGERFSFDGKFYQVQDCASMPRPAARPKIIIGGAGVKRTPTLAARYADEFNGALGLDVRERYANFRRICADVVGRDPAQVRLSATLPVCIGSSQADLERRKESLGAPGARLLAAGVTGTAGDVIRAIEDLAAQGADTVYFHLYGRDDVEHIRLLGSQVVSRFLRARQGYSGGTEASLDGRDEFLRDGSQHRGPRLPAASEGRGHRHAARLVRRGVAAQQARVGDVLDVPQRGAQRGGVVPGLADGGADRGGADLRPRGVVPVNVPHHAVHDQARVSRQHAAEIVQCVHVPDGHPQRHRGGHLPAPLQPAGFLIVVLLLTGRPGMRRPRQRAASCAFIERHRAQGGQVSGQAIQARADRPHRLRLGSRGVLDHPVQHGIVGRHQPPGLSTDRQQHAVRIVHRPILACVRAQRLSCKACGASRCLGSAAKAA